MARLSGTAQHLQVKSQANLTRNTVYRRAHQYPGVSLYFVSTGFIFSLVGAMDRGHR